MGCTDRLSRHLVPLGAVLVGCLDQCDVEQLPVDLHQLQDFFHDCFSSCSSLRCLLRYRKGSRDSSSSAMSHFPLVEMVIHSSSQVVFPHSPSGMATFSFSGSGSSVGVLSARGSGVGVGSTGGSASLLFLPSRSALPGSRSASAFPARPEASALVRSGPRVGSGEGCRGQRSGRGQWCRGGRTPA